MFYQNILKTRFLIFKTTTNIVKLTKSVTNNNIVKQIAYLPVKGKKKKIHWIFYKFVKPISYVEENKTNY